MENKKSKGKIVALICSLVVVVGLLTTGVVLAATGALSGLFSGDKAKAFELLAQAPEKLAYSALDEQLGANELYKAMLEKGMDINFKISDMKVSEGNVDLSGFSMDLAAQMDLAKKKLGGKIAVGKDGANMSAEGYASLDEKKVAFSLPEIIPNKSFCMTADDAESKDVLDRVSEILQIVPELQESFEEFIDEQGMELYDAAECTRDGDTYRLTISKDSMDAVLKQFQAWVSKEQDTIGVIEEKLELGNKTISSAISMLMPSLSAYTKDFTFEVQGQDGELSGIRTTIKVDADAVECPISVSFNTNGNQREIDFTMEALQNGASQGKIELSVNSKEGDICEDAVKYAVADEKGTDVLSYEIRETLDVKNNNALEVNASMNSDMGNMTVVAHGNIKNLESGKCITIQCDEVNMEQNMAGTKLAMTYAMEATLSVLDGEVSMASGEEVKITPATVESVLDSYEKEAQKNMDAIIDKWGDLVPSSELSPSILDPVSSSYTSDPSASDEYDIEDDEDSDHGEYDEDVFEDNSDESDIGDLTEEDDSSSEEDQDQSDDSESDFGDVL